jgi:D-alanyl-D-alanine endopeptidase (penicillin-binding protein 7)
MNLRLTRFRLAAQWAVGALLAASLSMPMGAAASTQAKPAAKAKKPEATQQADRKKAVSKRVVSNKTTGKSAQGSQSRVAAKAGQPAAQKKAQKLASSRKGSAKPTQSARQTELAKASGKKVRVAKNSATRQAGKRNQVASHGKKRNQVALVAHSRPAAAQSVVLEPRLSTGERLGLRESEDPLELSSSVALVMDQETSEVLFSKNENAVLPIASLTKLMTGLVIADANLPMDESITITEEDAAVYRQSRLAVGAQLTRGELMHLSLMSSENRAANALGRTFPGGASQFVRRMNAKAQELGMQDTRFVEPTGLSSQNQSSARDLATLVSVSYQRQILRDLSTSPSHQLELGHRTLQYNNSNRLIRNPEWEIGLQKTGYIAAAGRCLVMQAKVAGRKVIMVFLDSAGKLTRVQDAERVRRWVEAQRYQQYFVRPQG